jgi:hypothetical protein
MHGDYADGLLTFYLNRLPPEIDFYIRGLNVNAKLFDNQNLVRETAPFIERLRERLRASEKS